MGKSPDLLLGKGSGYMGGGGGRISVAPQDCSKQFGSGTAILHSFNNHTHTAMAVPAL